MIYLSIIIPVYKVEEYIEKCLSSIFATNISLDLFEVIIVNDGTPDGSMNIVAKFSVKYNNIIVYSQENKGLSEARNVGANLAKGKYLWFVDSDDWLPAGAIERIYKQTNYFKVDVLAINFIYSSGKKSPFYNKGNEGSIYSGKEFLRMNTIEIPAQYYVLNTTFFHANSFRFHKGVYHEDVLFTPTMLFSANTVLYDRTINYIYNLRENSIMTSGSALKHSTDMVTVTLELCKFQKIKAKNYSEKKLISKYILLAIGGTYYYWKQLDNNNKLVISKSLPIKFFIKTFLLNFYSKYIVALLIMKLKCLKLI